MPYSLNGSLDKFQILSDDRERVLWRGWRLDGTDAAGLAQPQRSEDRDAQEQRSLSAVREGVHAEGWHSGAGTDGWGDIRIGRQLGVAYVLDLTERKHAKEEHEKLRQLDSDIARMNRLSMMGELTASLAHQITQPIAAARGANPSKWRPGGSARYRAGY
jgi:C4-dicarboxylate-specific signal transduction histidine kinase